jgi:hypothetical protein
MHTPPSHKRPDRERASGARTLFTLILFLTLPLGFMACPGDSKRNDSPNAGTAPTPSASPAASPARLSIDGQRAFEHVRKQVEMGPRPAGSPELARTRDYLIGELKSYGLNVSTDEFQATTPVGQRKMANVLAELPGESPEVIILSSHYDTKLFKQFRFVGANDAGSSTGTLLEMARALSAAGRKPRFTYWFVFFDGEEAFCEEWEDCHNPDGPDNTYGSRHFVAQLRQRNETRRVRAMVLLDMIGYKELRLGRDEDMSTGWLMDAVWQSARELGHGAQFVEETEGVGGDDHEPFLKAGIDSLDIIQLSTYPYWHRAEDTLDKISPQSLKIVGDTVLASLPRIEQHLLEHRAP